MAAITKFEEYDAISALTSSSYRQFSLAEIKEALKNFDRTINIVALTKFTNHFQREVCALMKIQQGNKNLVSLIGYCLDSNERILVYKYMKNGSLALADYNTNGYKSWSWKKKLKICLQVAYSLQELHSPTTLFPFGMSHGYVYPSNIGLDENWDAKLSYFKDCTIVRNNSTIEKCNYKPKDVRGLGVILLSFLPCSRSLDVEEFINSIENNDFKVWAEKYMSLESQREDEISFDSLKSLIDATMKCLEPDRSKRATIDDVVLDLEATLNLQDLHQQPIPTKVDLLNSSSKDSRILGGITEPNLLDELSKVTNNLKEITTSSSSFISSSFSTHNISSFSCSPSSLSLLVASYRQFSLTEINDVTINLDKERSLKKGIYWIEYLVQMNIYSKTEKTCVIVKQFKENCTDEFEKEIQMVTKIQAHPNLTSLLGYCIESGEYILIYNYPVHGSLLDYVNLGSPVCLSWKERLNICLGAALGLDYLHKETNEFPDGIIHGAVNPANILIDKNWVAKVSNYAGSHIAQSRSSFSTTTVEDPFTCYAPEYVNSRHVTQKVDVYAFGIVLFQVICRRNIWVRGEESKLGYIEKSYSRWANENLDNAIKDGLTEDSLRTLTDCIGKCLEPNPYRRPSMGSVVLDIKKALNILVDEGEAIDINTSFRTKTRISGVTTSSVSFSLSSSYCRRFTLNEIKDATNNFDVEKRLGKGGEGTVYLAEVYLDSNTEKLPVAVKILDKEITGEFQKEIETVTKIKHPNIVSLLGYCCESDERVLIYEYMGKGSLADYVKMNSKVCLSWKQRLNICLGAAYGLLHLHRETEIFPYGIIHRDVKPENILINENWNAKVSDFGMLKLSNVAQTRSTFFTDFARGTQGYYAPECAMYSEKQLTRKIDVYSFGLVMFEVLCRKRMWEAGDGSIYQGSVDVALLADENIDIQIKDQISEASKYKFIDIIAASLRSEPKRRPSMNDVVHKLEAALKYQEESEIFKEINAPS